MAACSLSHCSHFGNLFQRWHASFGNIYSGHFRFSFDSCMTNGFRREPEAFGRISPFSAGWEKQAGRPDSWSKAGRWGKKYFSRPQGWHLFFEHQCLESFQAWYSGFWSAEERKERSFASFFGRGIHSFSKFYWTQCSTAIGLFCQRSRE